MSASRPAINYGNARPRRLWALWVAVAATAILLSLGGMWWRPLASWLRDAQRYHRVVNAPRLSQPLLLTLPIDSPTTRAADLLAELYPRLRPWMAPLSAAEADLANLVASRMPSSPGDPGRLFIGVLRPKDGEPRLVSIGANVMAMNDGSRGILSFHVELFEVGSILKPHIGVVRVKEEPTGDYRGSILSDRHWATFDRIMFRAGQRFTLGAPIVATNDPASLHVPLSLNAVDDTLTITLDAGDIVRMRLASGRTLPIRLPAATQPATTRSAR